jgi:hypothetical protein
MHVSSVLGSAEIIKTFKASAASLYHRDHSNSPSLSNSVRNRRLLQQASSTVTLQVTALASTSPETVPLHVLSTPPTRVIRELTWCLAFGRSPSTSMASFMSSRIAWRSSRGHARRSSTRSALSVGLHGLSHNPVLLRCPEGLHWDAVHYRAPCVVLTLPGA